jgi:spermidine/putrescine transport system ATP-binding protein
MVKLSNVVKAFSGEADAAVKGISLDISEGEFLTILGPSGCGKTTTLRIIAGFEQADSGTVLINGSDVSAKAPYERNVNTVFQNYALFPHLNVYENVAFGLRIKKLGKDQIRSRVSDILKTVQMEGYEDRMPDQLSGGQKQRVAIARAIINNPKVLLLDEPLGALDLKLRRQMQLELKHLQKKLGITFIFVTHDQEEAMTMSDRICVMNNGLIEQVGTPEDIYEHPKTRFVADFIGETNIFEGSVVSAGNNYTEIRLPGGQNVRIRSNNVTSQTDVCFAIRPERLKLKLSPDTEFPCLPVTFKERTYTGSIVRTIVTLSGGRDLTVSEPSAERLMFSEGTEKEAYVTWDPENVVVMQL